MILATTQNVLKMINLGQEVEPPNSHAKNEVSVYV